MKTYLECKDGKNHKFWQIEVNDNSHTVSYGKVGTDGRTIIKTFDSKDKALKEAQK